MTVDYASYLVRPRENNILDYAMQARDVKQRNAMLGVQKQKLEDERLRQVELRTAAQGLVEDSSPENYKKTFILYPELLDRVKATTSFLSDERKKPLRRGAMRLFSAIGSYINNKDESELNREVELLRDGAQSDEELAFIDSMSARAKKDPKWTRVEVGAWLGSEYGAEGLADILAKQQKAQSEREERPINIKKLKADLDLTNAQVVKTLADAKKINAEASTKEALLKARAAKDIGNFEDTKEFFDAESKLRNEYVKNTGDFIKVSDAYERIKAVEATPAGDLSMIFNYMKMLDPGSTVREGEFANAQNSGSVPQRMRAKYNQLLKGTRLDVTQRADFKRQSDKLYKAAQKREGRVRKGMQPIIDEFGFSGERIFVGAPGQATGEEIGTGEAPMNLGVTDSVPPIPKQKSNSAPPMSENDFASKYGAM